MNSSITLDAKELPLNSVLGSLDVRGRRERVCVCVHREEESECVCIGRRLCVYRCLRGHVDLVVYQLVNEFLQLNMW